MLLAFLYCADVARNEGGCNELVGTFMNVDDALAHCLSLIETDKYKHSDVHYADIVEIKHQGAYIRHFVKRATYDNFAVSNSYAVSHYPERYTNGGVDCPY